MRAFIVSLSLICRLLDCIWFCYPSVRFTYKDHSAQQRLRDDV
jgi:hypothetical protein